MTVQAVLLQMALRVEHDIFVVRQRGREVAAAVGLEHQDQVRIATALSEVARDLLHSSGGADVTFAVVDGAAGRSVLQVDLAPVRPLPDGRYEPQSGAVARLVDMLGVIEGQGDTVVRMSRRVPANAPRRTSSSSPPSTRYAANATSWPSTMRSCRRPTVA